MPHSIHNLAVYIRRLFKYKSNAFTCCAGCDALPVPLGKRFCVSRCSVFPVDAVLTGAWDASSACAMCSALGASMPWLRRVFVPFGASDDRKDAASILPEGMDENSLHLLEDLSEYFLLVPWKVLGMTLKSLMREDFFTVNGMPLLFAAPGGSADAPSFLPGISGRTKNLCARFAENRAAISALSAQDEYAFARWAYTERHGVLAPSPFDI